MARASVCVCVRVCACVCDIDLSLVSAGGRERETERRESGRECALKVPGLKTNGLLRRESPFRFPEHSLRNPACVA